MNSGFRRYTSMSGNPPASTPNAGAAPLPAPPVTTAPATAPVAEPAPAITSRYEKEHGLFGEVSHMIAYTSGGGKNVAVFDYGYFGSDGDPAAVQSGGGTSSGGGSKLTSDSKQAPSPFSSIFGGS